MQNHKFIFIGGLHRSGTSILFQCLRDHPLISGFSGTGVCEDEGQHLQTVYLPAKCYGGPGRFGFNKMAHLTERSTLITEENREILFSEWGKFWDLQRPFLLEKSPPTLIMTRFFQQMFPESYFIIIMRHPVAVAFATQRFVGGKATIYSLIRHWVAAHEIFHRDKAHLKNLLVLQYEDFVKDPHYHLENIYSFLDIKAYSTSLQIRTKINQKYFDKWRGYRNTTYSRLYTDYIRLRFENRANKFGYSLLDLEST